MIPAAPSPHQEDAFPALSCVRRPGIDAVAAEWDGFVPRDLPHLRAGFLRAVERGGVVRAPAYLLVYRDGRLAAAAFSYTVLVDAAQSMPPGMRRWVAWVRRAFPGFLQRPMRVCGPPVSNSESGVYFDPQLADAERRRIFDRIAEEVLRAAGFRQTVFFKEFNAGAEAAYASGLERLGFFRVDPGPGTRLDLPWESFEAYQGAMRKEYRRRIRKDLLAAEELDFELLDSFADLAPQAAALYGNVLRRAESNLETATEAFFTAVSAFDQARLLVARRRATGEVVGVNLLLFGDVCMHNSYIGLDYTQNERVPIYFTLIEHSVRVALERKCRVCYFGPASYEFKARLGARPFPVTAYMKHRLWPVHRMLLSSRDTVFSKTEVPVHDVFQPPAKGT